MVGIQPGDADLPGTMLMDVVPDDLMPQCCRLITEAFHSRLQQVFEFQRRVKEDLRAFEARLIPCGPERVFITFSDITQRKWSELWISESEAHFRSIFEASPVAISVSSEGLHVFVNPAYLRLFGYDHDSDLLGRSVLDLIAPGHRSALETVLQRRRSGDPGPASFGTLALRKDSSVFPVNVSSSVYERLGRLYSVAHIQPDERSQAEKWTSAQNLDSLSGRQREVLRLIAEGQSTKQVAATLGISFKTADTHRSNLMQKLNAHETATLVRLAVHFGLVAP
jgi:PAS domain S-box-containing protein